MMRAALMFSCAAALCSLEACHLETCDAKALPLEGSYRVANAFDVQRPDAVLQAEMNIGEDEVTIEYTRGRPGKRWRATYAIRARGKGFR